MKYTQIACAMTLLLTGGVSSASSTHGPDQKQPAVRASMGKPAAPVTVAFDYLGATAAVLGVPLSVKVVVTPTTEVDELVVRFGLSDGLESAQKLPLLGQGAQKSGASLVQSLVLLPRAEGQQYLNVFVSTRQGQQRLSKVVAYPLGIGTVTPNKPSASLQIDPDGERIISMPAIELR